MLDNCHEHAIDHEYYAYNRYFAFNFKLQIVFYMILVFSCFVSQNFISDINQSSKTLIQLQYTILKKSSRTPPSKSKVLILDYKKLLLNVKILTPNPKTSQTSVKTGKNWIGFITF